MVAHCCYTLFYVQDAVKSKTKTKSKNKNKATKKADIKKRILKNNKSEKIKIKK